MLLLTLYINHTHNHLYWFWLESRLETTTLWLKTLF